MESCVDKKLHVFQEAKFETILNSIEDLILVKGEKSRLLWANKAFLDYYGTSLEELQGIVDAAHSDPDNTVQYIKDDHYVFSTANSLMLNEPITNFTGDTEYYQTIKTALKNSLGEIYGTVGVSRKIFDEKVVEESRSKHATDKASLTELRTLTNSIPLPVAMTDARQRIIACSEKWKSIFSSNEHSIIAEYYEDCCEKRLPISQQLSFAISSSMPVVMEAVKMELNKSQKSIFDIHVQPWKMPDGKTGGAIILLLDITELKNKTLRLEMANEELTQFNYRVSHDLLAPLRSIKGFINISKELIDSGDLEGAKQLHHRINESVDQLSTLVQDVMNLARSDMAPSSSEDVHLKTLVKEILCKHEFQIEEQNFTIVMDGICEEVVKVEKVRIRQILENLISNGLKYFNPDAAEKRLEICLEVRGNELKMNVIDNGIGIPLSIKDRIFDIFTRGSSSQPGSGLGLYLVKKHISKLKGTIAILNDSGLTNFEVRIPINR